MAHRGVCWSRLPGTTAAVSDCAPRHRAVSGSRQLQRLSPPQPPPKQQECTTQLDSGFQSDLQSPGEAPLPLQSSRSEPLGTGPRAANDSHGPSERTRRYVHILNELFGGNDDGDTHLHLAIIGGLFSVAVWLVKLAPHPNVLNLRNNRLQTPVHLAVLTGQSCLCRHLVVAGASTSIYDGHGSTPLHLACQHGDRRCLSALTAEVTVHELRQMRSQYSPSPPPPSSPPPVNEWNYQGLSCLHLATLAGDCRLVAELVSLGALVGDGEGKSGRTPLHLAVETGDTHMLRFLVEACRADLEAPTYGGLSGYQLALLYARRDVVDTLRELGARHRQPPSDDDDDEEEEEDMDTSRCV